MIARRRAEGVLLLVTAVWGTTFVAVKAALDSWPPLLLLGVRFALAAAVFLPVLLRPGAVSARTLRRGVVLGVLLYLGFGLQTLGLARTTEARSAFFTALSVLLVPLFGYAFLRRPILAGTWAAILFGAGGIFLLLGGALEATVRTGDLLTVGCALAFAVQILLLAGFARDTPVLALTGIELGTTALLGLLSALLAGERLPPLDRSAVGLLLYLGLFATAASLLGQVWGQRGTTANRAAFLYALEPAFAVLFAWVARGRILEPREWFGGALVVAAALFADRALPRAFRAARGAA